MDLNEISLGVAAHDKITGVKGIVTAKLERLSGENSVCLEGADSTGRAFDEWIGVDRVELDATA